MYKLENHPHPEEADTYTQEVHWQAGEDLSKAKERLHVQSY